MSPGNLFFVDIIFYCSCFTLYLDLGGPYATLILSEWFLVYFNDTKGVFIDRGREGKSTCLEGTCLKFFDFDLTHLAGVTRT